MEYFKEKLFGDFNKFVMVAVKIFRAAALVFVVSNYIWIFSFGESNTGMIFHIPQITVISIIYITLLLYGEPRTYNRYPTLNRIINMAMVVCSGSLFFTCRTYTMVGVIFLGVVITGLRMPVIDSMMYTIFYYIAYLVPRIMGVKPINESFLLDTNLFLVFMLILYFCSSLSRLRNAKTKRDSAIVRLLNEKITLAKDLEEKNSDLEQAYWDMVETLIGVIEARDRITGSHSIKVCEYSVKLAKELGFDDDRISDIMKASILHDIGKMGIPDSILMKPGSLTVDEYCTIKNHPEIGCNILRDIRGLENVLPMILYHHERIDGKGYPYGLKGDEIPDGAKIIAIADSYDAMTSNRPYRKGMLKKEAKERLLAGAGTQFEAGYVEKFINVIDRENVYDIRGYRHIDNIKKRAQMV